MGLLKKNVQSVSYNRNIDTTFCDTIQIQTNSFQKDLVYFINQINLCRVACLVIVVLVWLALFYK